MQVLLYKLNNQTYDITQLTGAKKLDGSITSAPRTFSTSFLRTKDVDVDMGDMIIYLNNSGKELFRGFVFSRNLTKLDTRDIKAYDQLIYWVKNKDTFTFSNSTASQIFKDVCQRFQIPMGQVDDTLYPIGEQINPDNTLWDVVSMALKTTKDQTGLRFCIRDINGSVNLLKRADMVHAWAIEFGSNLIDYSFNESIEDMATAVKLISSDKENTLIATAEDNDLIKQFGLLQYFKKESDKLNQAQLQERANQIMKSNGKVKREFSLNAIGIDDVIAGDVVYVDIPLLGIKKVYYVESDSHTYQDNLHTMNLKLFEADDVEGVVS